MELNLLFFLVFPGSNNKQLQRHTTSQDISQNSAHYYKVITVDILIYKPVQQKKLSTQNKIIMLTTVMKKIYSQDTITIIHKKILKSIIMKGSLIFCN